MTLNNGVVRPGIVRETFRKEHSAKRLSPSRGAAFSNDCLFRLIIPHVEVKVPGKCLAIAIAKLGPGIGRSHGGPPV